MRQSIVIKGARAHNLKNIDLEIPRDKLVVFTGLSGSGKSSLAFDTIYAEGQRRYVESLSSYARQFLGQMEKPDVDYIDGLSPAISIDQKTTSKNPRSTVGTVTEIRRLPAPSCTRAWARRTAPSAGAKSISRPSIRWSIRYSRCLSARAYRYSRRLFARARASTTAYLRTCRSRAMCARAWTARYTIWAIRLRSTKKRSTRLR